MFYPVMQDRKKCPYMARPGWVGMVTMVAQTRQKHNAEQRQEAMTTSPIKSKAEAVSIALHVSALLMNF